MFAKLLQDDTIFCIIGFDETAFQNCELGGIRRHPMAHSKKRDDDNRY